jgi:putative transposase
MVGPAAKREAVAHLQAELGLSERRACSIVSADRKMIRYQSCRPPDTELRVQLRELANARRRSLARARSRARNSASGGRRER